MVYSENNVSHFEYFSLHWEVYIVLHYLTFRYSEFIIDAVWTLLQAELFKLHIDDVIRWWCQYYPAQAHITATNPLQHNAILCPQKIQFISQQVVLNEGKDGMIYLGKWYFTWANDNLPCILIECGFLLVFPNVVVLQLYPIITLFTTKIMTNYITLDLDVRSASAWNEIAK